MTKKTADDLVSEGKRLNALGHLVVLLHPSQEWMAVEIQTPFLRYEKMMPIGNRSEGHEWPEPKAE